MLRAQGKKFGQGAWVGRVGDDDDGLASSALSEDSSGVEELFGGRAVRHLDIRPPSSEPEADDRARTPVLSLYTRFALVEKVVVFGVLGVFLDGLRPGSTDSFVPLALGTDRTDAVLAAQTQLVDGVLLAVAAPGGVDAETFVGVQMVSAGHGVLSE